MSTWILEMQTADLAAAGSSEDVYTIPASMGGAVKSISVFVDTANCTGTSAALTCAVLTGADGSEASFASVSGHATNDQQELSMTLTKTAAGSNLAGGTRVQAKTTVAGGSTAVATGVRYRIEIERPALPA